MRFLLNKMFPIGLLLFVNLVQLAHSSVEVTITPINEIEESVDMLSHSAIPSHNFASDDTVGTSTTEMIHKISREEDDKRQMHNSNSETCSERKQSFLLVPDASNCSNYYEVCPAQFRLDSLNGSRVKTCPNGKYFDSISGQCVKEGNAYCGVYECGQPDGFFQDPTSRYTFIQCFDNVPKRKSCEPKGTVFFNDSKVCMWVPEEIPLGLGIFQAFLWLVKLTEPADSPDGFVDSTEDYIKASTVAVLIPVLYLITVVVLYKQFNPSKNRSDTCFLSDADELHYRYYRRPTSSGAANMDPTVIGQASRNVLNDNYFVTSSC